MGKKNKTGLYKWILKERSGIDISILDSISPSEDIDKNFFAPVAKLDDFIMVRQRSDLEALGARLRKSIHSFPDFIKALELEFKRLSEIVIGVKIALAYFRELRFDKVSQNEAEECFVNIFNSKFFRREIPAAVLEGLSLRDTKPLQDFLVHRIIQLAAENDLPIQIHTGIQEGNDNIITNSNPTLLINIFSEYKEVKFDVFHGSYPFTSELAVLAKNFQNVYIDMCWLHIISPYGARRALAEWLDTVPMNKILGFGGDFIFAEGVYGHSVIARENIARVLIEKVEERSLNEREAIGIAQKLLWENAHKFFF